MNQDTPNIETAHISLHGNRRYNQDRYAVLEHEGCYLLVLADGLGGHPKGDVAAEYLIHASELFFPKQFDRTLPIAPFFQLIINHAHHQIIRFGEQEVPPIKPKTTAVLALIKDEQVHWGHVGDSRLYLFRNKKVMFRTKDHTYAQELLRRGLDIKKQQKPAQKPNALVRCVGGGTKPPTIEMGPLVPLLIKDVIVLCSDGFWGQLDARKISQAFEDPASLSIILAALGQQALETAFPKSDNVTAVALRKWRNQPKNKSSVVEKKIVKKQTPTDELNTAIDSLEDFIKKVEQDLK